MEQDTHLSPLGKKPLVSLLEGYSTRETQIIKTFICPYVEYLQSKGILLDQLKPFSQLLIKFSLLENKPNNAPNYGKMKKDDFYVLLRYLFEKMGRSDLIKIRCFKRINYDLKDILFAYVAIERPDIMYQIANNYFIEFGFHLKLYNKEKVSSEWINYVDDLQKAAHYPISSVRESALNFNVCPGRSLVQ